MTVQELIEKLQKTKDFLQNAKAYDDKDYIEAATFEIESILKYITKEL